MAITKTILKKVRQQAFIELVGDGTANIDLNADLALADETFLGYANANVNISSIVFSIGNTTNHATITRSGTTILRLWGNDNWPFSQQFGFVLNQNNTANISVTIPSDGGTVILGLTKVSGYREPDQQSVPR